MQKTRQICYSKQSNKPTAIPILRTHIVFCATKHDSISIQFIIYACMSTYYSKKKYSIDIGKKTHQAAQRNSFKLFPRTQQLI